MLDSVMLQACVSYLSPSISVSPPSQIWTSVSSFPLSVHETGPSASTHMAGTVVAATSVATEVLSPMRMARLVLVSGSLGTVWAQQKDQFLTLGLLPWC